MTSKGLPAAVLLVAIALAGCTPSVDLAPLGTTAEASGASDPPASGSPRSVAPGPPLPAMTGELTIWHPYGGRWRRGVRVRQFLVAFGAAQQAVLSGERDPTAAAGRACAAMNKANAQ